jgi:hypothetical protein
VAICLTALLRSPFGLLCYSLAFVFPSWSSLLGFSVFVGSFVFVVVVGFSSCLQLLLSKFPHSHNTHLQKKKTHFAEDNTHLQKTHLLFLGFCFPEELGNVGEEYGAPIVIFLLHYGTHWSKSGHLGGGGRQGGKQTG